MYPIDRRGWSQVEGVIVVECMFFCDQGCKVGIVVYIKDGDRFKQGMW